MSALQLEELSRQVYGLQLRIGVINYSLMNADLVKANLELQINRLRNAQVGLRSQATASAFSHLPVLPFNTSLVYAQERMMIPNRFLKISSRDKG
jgi:hypothetical protein